jgi:N-carbamoyl-L-amino-acid hydrolase
MTGAALTAGGSLAGSVLDRLADATADAPGVTRVAYGPGERFAHRLVREEAEKLGASARVDAAGNLYLTLHGRDPGLPAIVIGSHLDSVPHGGNFDGAAGVVAGLAVMAEFVAQDTRPARSDRPGHARRGSGMVPSVISRQPGCPRPARREGAGSEAIRLRQDAGRPHA